MAVTLRKYGYLEYIQNGTIAVELGTLCYGGGQHKGLDRPKIYLGSCAAQILVHFCK